MAKNIEENLLIRDQLLLEITKKAMEYCNAIYIKYKVIPKKVTLTNHLKDECDDLCERVEDFEIEMVVDRVHYRWSSFYKRMKKFYVGIQKTPPTWPSIRSGYILESTKTNIQAKPAMII